MENVQQLLEHSKLRESLRQKEPNVLGQTPNRQYIGQWIYCHHQDVLGLGKKYNHIRIIGSRQRVLGVRAI